MKILNVSKDIVTQTINMHEKYFGTMSATNRNKHEYSFVFNIDKKVELLSEDKSESFHSTAAKQLRISRQAQLDV